MSPAAAPPWLLLIHQIPPKPDYFRVRVRRQLQRLGAIAVKSSVYVLPHTEEAIEDFQWLRRSVVDDGGEATLCTASFIEGVSNQEVESMFRAQANAEYDEILRAAAAVRTAPSDADARRLEHQLERAKARDFFAANQAQAATRAVQEIAHELAQRRETRAAGAERSDGIAPHGATWVTRTGVHVDRIASAWLIRRFIDPIAQFRFVPAKGYKPGPGELRFDMYEGEFTHAGDQCTFEVLQARFHPSDTALHAIADIVHDIDCKDDKYGRDETPGVATVIRGITLAHQDDASRVAAGMGLFDGLYASLQRQG